MKAVVRIAIAVSLGLLTVTPALAMQGPGQDRGVFRVRRGTTAIGREEFTIERVPAPGGATAVTISSINHYPPAPPLRTFARFGPRRITVRLETPSTEVAREYPAASSLVADDSVFAVYAIAASLPPGEIRVLYPRSGQRAAGQIVDRGTAETTIGETTLALRYLVVDRGAGGEVHLWFDADSRLMKVSLPSRRLVAEREM